MLVSPFALIYLAIKWTLYLLFVELPRGVGWLCTALCIALEPLGPGCVWAVEACCRCLYDAFRACVSVVHSVQDAGRSAVRR